MGTLNILFNGEAMPVIKIRVLGREIEKTTGPQMPFHELLDAREEVEYTAQGPRKIVRGKPMSWAEFKRREGENPNRVYHGVTTNPAFLYQVVATFAACKFTSAPWGEAAEIPLGAFQSIRIEGNQWLVLPSGLRVPGVVQDLPADERAANESRLAREAQPCRIWTTFSAGGEYAGAWRELHEIKRNERGDFLFALDGGEVWQFTPNKPMKQTPNVAEVDLLGIGKDSKTGKPCSIIAFMVLKNPKRDFTGNLRILPPVSEAVRALAGETKHPAPSPNPKGRKPEYDEKEDARIYALWMDAQSMGRVPVQQFYDDNETLHKNYTPKKLRLLLDRERQRMKKSIIEARRKK